MITRHPLYIISDDESFRYDFPMLEGFEWERNQPLRTPVAYAAGAHYAYDLLSGEVGRKDSGEERLRFLAYERCGPNDLDDHIDDLSEAFFEMGAGKLFVIDSRNALRWARVRATEMPQVTWVLDTTVGKSLPVIASLRRDSDWASPVAVTYTYNITTNPQTISLTLPGNAKSFSPIVIMKGTYTNPSITNTSLLVPGLTTGYKIQSTKDGSSANHWLKYDAGEHTVEFSSDAGVNYITNYGDNVRQAGQVQLFALKPGLNSIDVTGSTSGTLVITTYSFWH